MTSSGLQHLVFDTHLALKRASRGRRMVPATNWRPLVVLAWLVVIDAGTWSPCSSNGGGACLTDPRAKDGYFLRSAAVNCVGLDSLRRSGRMGSCTEDELTKWRLEGCTVSHEESICGEGGCTGFDQACPVSQQIRPEIQEQEPTGAKQFENDRYVRILVLLSIGRHPIPSPAHLHDAQREMVPFSGEWIARWGDGTTENVHVPSIHRAGRGPARESSLLGRCAHPGWPLPSGLTPTISGRVAKGHGRERVLPRMHDFSKGHDAAAQGK